MASSADDFDRLDQLLRSISPEFEKLIGNFEKLDKALDGLDGQLNTTVGEVLRLTWSADQAAIQVNRLTNTLVQLAQATAILDGVMAKWIATAQNGANIPIPTSATSTSTASGSAADQDSDDTSGGKGKGKGADFNRLIKVLQTTLQGVSAVTQVANLALYGFYQQVNHIANRISGFVKLLNPGIVAQYERHLAAFNAQLGQVFAPILVGLGQLVRTVANALAGLSSSGRLFLAFLAGAVVGLGVVVVIGGVFIGVITAIAASAVAGAVAFEALGAALDFATAGISGAGALIGGILGVAGTGVAAGGGAAAGGLAALLVAGGAVDKLTAAMRPFLEVLTGTLNTVGERIIPRLTQVATDLLPLLSRAIEIAIQYLEPFSSVLASFAANILPPMLENLASMLEVCFPLIVILAKFSELCIVLAGSILYVVAAIGSLLVKLNPLLALFRLFYGQPARSPAGNAASPVTGVSYMGVEDAFKRAQEQALLGARVQQTTPVEREDVAKLWASVLAPAIASAIWAGAPGAIKQAGQIPANLAAGLAMALANGAVRIPGFGPQ